MLDCKIRLNGLGLIALDRTDLGFLDYRDERRIND